MEGKEEKIIKGTREIFRLKGIKTLTMDEIAKELQVSKKTMYVFFRNRQMLLKRTIEDFIEEDKRDLQGALMDSKDAVEAFCQISLIRTKTLRGMIPKYLQDLQKFYPKEMELLNKHIWSFIVQLYTKVIEKGIKEGNFRSEIEPDLMARLVLVKGLGVVNSNYFPANKYTFDQVFIEDTELFVRSIATEQGLNKMINQKCQLQQKLELVEI